MTLTSDNFGRARPSQAPKRVGSALLADRRGVAALEFAFVATPLMIFMFGILSLALHFYFQQSLEYAVQEASRQVQLGRIGQRYNQTTFVSQVLCPNFGPSCSNLYVDLHPVTDYQRLTIAGVSDAPDSISTANLQFCAGAPGQLMYAHVIYLSRNATGGLIGLGSPDAIIANAAFVNENPGGANVTPQNGC